MNVRELISALLEEDIDSTVYVRVIDDNTGDELFGEVDGIAVQRNSFRVSNMVYCTTIEICGLGK